MINKDKKKTNKTYQDLIINIMKYNINEQQSKSNWIIPIIRQIKIINLAS